MRWALNGKEILGRMIGFETIGNATLIIHDGVPLLATDPWFTGEPYFGSWNLSHEIPTAQKDHIFQCPYIWFSHGHPDHLSSPSLDALSTKTILLPDHVGRRIELGMIKEGFKVQVLPTMKWFDLSPRVKLMCLPDYNQDATLLVAIGDTLIIDFNDGHALGYQRFIKTIAKEFKRRYLLALRNYGDADMLNIWDDRGNFLPPPADLKPSVGKMYDLLAKDYNGTHLIPFSSFHIYQREDSIWASKYYTPLEAHYDDYSYPNAELLPAFIQVDLERDTVIEIDPKKLTAVPKPASAFGDNWSEPLEKDEAALCREYFLRKEHLRNHFGFINLKVGQVDNKIILNEHKKTGVTFEVPRNSLMTAIQFEIFDDLLIGNFMKTTLHGVVGLYPDFSPYVAKYGDNGQAQTERDLREYFQKYQERSPYPGIFLMTRVHAHFEDIFRRSFSNQSEFFKLSRRLYRAVRRSI